MAHAEHFLARLDRLSTIHVEEALLLYNDAPLLRALLGFTRVPDGVDRVAVALAEGGPYLLVTRGGQFVTCLGEGMVVNDVPIISRSKLDDFASKVGDLRGRMALARELTEKDPAGLKGLITCIWDVGPALSREQFRAMLLWQPLLAVPLLRLVYGGVTKLADLRTMLVQTRRGKRSRSLERVLREYWLVYWAVGHAMVLLASEGWQVLEQLPEELLDQVTDHLAWGAVRQGSFSHALRGAWAMGRFGKVMLPSYKRHYLTARTPTQLMTATLSLVALALRHQRLRAEIVKTLDVSPPANEHPETAALRKGLAITLDLIFSGSEDVGTTVDELCKFFVERRAVYRDEPIPDLGHLAQPAFVQALLGSELSNFHFDRTAYVLLPLFLTPIARAPAEHFYLPQADLGLISYGPWTPDHTEMLLLPLRDFSRTAPDPVKAPETPGRNEPCSCGSGKKFKKCCGGSA